MSDCANVEMREMLPELLHGMLSVGERVRVERHLAVCVDCREELALLRGALGAMHATVVPPVDIRAVVAALPRSPVMAAPRRQNALALRMAAALTVISLGGMSLLVARDRMGGAPVTASVDAPPASPVAEGATTVAMAPATVGSDSPSARAEGGLSTGGAITELGDAELRTLLGELERLEAAPAIEPESTPGERLMMAGAIGTEG